MVRLLMSLSAGLLRALGSDISAGDAWANMIFSSWNAPSHPSPDDEMGFQRDVSESSGGGRITIDEVEEVEKLVIFGSGPAGLTAAIYAARANLRPLLISRDDGQLASTSDVENYPGCGAKTGASIVDSFRRQASAFGARAVEAEVVSVDFSQDPFVLRTAAGDDLRFQSMIVATGANSKRLHGVEGEGVYYGRGVAACATCEGWFFKDQDVAVVGGGDTAMEEALFLSRICRSVTLVHRSDRFRASRIMVDRVMEHPKITVRTNATVSAFCGDGEQLTHVVLSDTQTEQEELLKVTGAFVAIGHVPNTHAFRAGPLQLDEDGYIVTSGSTRTNLEGVFAAGDVADRVYRQAITSAGLGAMAAMDAERHLCHMGC